MLIARSVHPLPGEAERKERLLALVDGFASRRVLVVGDLIADEFIYGEVARVSREAPVLILKYDATEMVAGGAGNAANNVAALGGRARARRPGRAPTPRAGGCSAAFSAASIARASCARAEYRTPVKTRILAGGVHSAKQQVVRIDRETGVAARRSGQPRVRDESCAAGARRCDAVLLSDYGSGLVTPALADAVRTALARANAAPCRCRCCVDSRYRLLDYRGPDDVHAERVGSRAGARHPHRRRRRRRSSGPAGALLRRTAMQAVLITRGSRGMALFQPRQPTVHVPIFGSDEVADVTGAGDTVIATFARARRRRIVLRGGAPRQLRRRAGGDEARHGHRVGAGARRRDRRPITTRRSRTGRRKGRRRGGKTAKGHDKA